MKLKEVSTSSIERDFILAALPIYKDIPNWVRPLDKDIKAVFDRKKNATFQHGDCTRWVLYHENGSCIGRIAAFINEKTAKEWYNEQPTGGIGFFECINDQAAANLLFDTAKEWLAARGMEAMDGPINFGERLNWWGLIIEGFHSPQYKMNYNPPYYRALFENYGFQPFFEQYCYAMPIDIKLGEKFVRRHNMVGNDPAFRAVHYRKSQRQKFVEDFTTIHNKAWRVHGEGKETTVEEVLKEFKEMTPVIDEKVIWFVYHHDDPIAFWINIPDINQIFKLFNGKFGWIEKIRFLWYLKRRYCTRFIGLIFGIVPEYHARGIDGYILVEGTKVMQELKLYDEYEVQWIGDFNPKMVNLVRGNTTNRSRRFITYRKLFDDNKLFKRMPRLQY